MSTTGIDDVLHSPQPFPAQAGKEGTSSCTQLRAIRADKLRHARQAAAAFFLALIVCAASNFASAEPFEDTPSAAAKDPDYAAGKAAMDKKNWPEAAKRFQQALLRDPDSADLHNYLGFSYRNLTRMDLALKHYKRSIEINPRHRGAHEYIGEAYLMMKDLPNAEKHLAALRNICLLPCEELADLEKAVRAYRAKK